MQRNELFRVGSVIKSFYNEDVFKIEEIHKSPIRKNKYIVRVISLVNERKSTMYLSYQEFIDNYYVVKWEYGGKSWR